VSGDGGFKSKIKGKKKERSMRSIVKRKGIISGHAPKHLREEVLELVANKELLGDKEKAKRLYDLLGKLWNCTDTIPAGNYGDIVTDCLKPYCSKDISYDIRPAKFTYAMLARNFRPSLRVFIELKKI
jgi:hypothetical protein